MFHDQLPLSTMTCTCSIGRATQSNKRNCWEHMHCGREPGGDKIGQLGDCPAHSEVRFTGTNGGKGGGRYCWRVIEKGPEDLQAPHWSDRNRNCLCCSFMSLVRTEEGRDFKP